MTSRSVTILFLATAGCAYLFEPAVTGPTGMVGRLLDGGGVPVAGVKVQTLESQQTTGEDGRFMVEYKRPDQLLFFDWRGAWYQRIYLPEDEGQVVDVRLPLLRDLTLECGLDRAAELELRWDLGAGLTARRLTPCEPGATALLDAVPRSTPTVTATSAGAPLDLLANDLGDRLVLLPPLVAVRVEVRPEGEPPERCVVAVGDRVAVASGAGFWTAEATGTVTATAICDGRPALPRTVRVQDLPEGQGDAAAPIALEWSAAGPDLDLAGPVPLAGDLWLVSERADATGWSLRVAPSGDGTYALPPLPEGTYRVVLGDPGALAVVPMPEQPTEAGVLRVVAVTPGDGATPGGLVGVLRLEKDLGEGRVPVSGLD